MASRPSSICSPTSIPPPRWPPFSRSTDCARSSSTRLPATGRPANAASRRCPAAKKNFATVFCRLLSTRCMLHCPRIHVDGRNFSAGSGPRASARRLHGKSCLGRGKGAGCRQSNCSSSPSHCATFRDFSSIARKKRTRLSPKSARPISKSSWTSSIARWKRAIWPSGSASISRTRSRPASATSKSPACPSATSPTRAK